MRKHMVFVAMALAWLPSMSSAATPLNELEKTWRYHHPATDVTDQFSTAFTFDGLPPSAWGGPKKVQDASAGSLLQHINSSIGGSVVIHNHVHDGLAVANEDAVTTPVRRLDVTAVPEPSTYVMLMAGFILMSFVSYRRRRDKFKL